MSIFAVVLKEQHFILKGKSVEQLLKAEGDLLAEKTGEGYQVAVKRFFLSEPEQIEGLPDENGAVSYIVQPPLDGNVIAEWLYLITDVASVNYTKGRTVATDTVRCNATDNVPAGTREFIWDASMHSFSEGSEQQTEDILKSYEGLLEQNGMTLADNCVRTWFFVHDIDNNYGGLVKARRENFTGQGLTPQTHYIASTGIAGTSPFFDRANSNALSGDSCTNHPVVQFDAYAIKGEFKQTYLYARTHLNPTYEYGVTFERGVKLEFGDHTQVLISGTASIDNKGQVLHKGDVIAQALRMFENVEALLSEAGSGWGDVQEIVVYLRNADDYKKIAPLFEERFPDIPYVITLAPVCRPDWLIEMECISCPA